MAYSDDINALSPTHAFSFDGNATDRIGALGSTSTTVVYTGAGICEGVTNSMVTDGISDILTLSDSPSFTNVGQPRLAVCGWLLVTAIQNPPKHALLIGGLSHSLRILVGWGNALMFEAYSAGNFSLQVFGDTSLEVNRPYHLCMVFEGNGFGNEFRCYLDGVKQLNAEPTNRQPNFAELPSRTSSIYFGVNSGNSAVGGTVVDTLALINGRHNEWAFFDGANAVLTDTQIREELFEKGAVPDVTLTSDTEANMQTALDVYASTERPDAPLAFRIEAPV